MILTPKDPRYRRKMETTLKLAGRAKNRYNKHEKPTHLFNPFTMEKKKKHWYQEPTFKGAMIGLHSIGAALIIGVSIYQKTFMFFPGGWFILFAWVVVVGLSYFLRNNP